MGLFINKPFGVKEMLECPECGEDIEGNIEWEREPKPSGSGLAYEGKCPKCGHEFKEIYSRSGIWDKENREYIERT